MKLISGDLQNITDTDYDYGWSFIKKNSHQDYLRNLTLNGLSVWLRLDLLPKDLRAGWWDYLHLGILDEVNH